MRKSKSDQRKQELKAIKVIGDDQIDLSDVPELTEEQLRRSGCGQMYRPTKKQSTRQSQSGK
jgi:hypothetical protein